MTTFTIFPIGNISPMGQKQDIKIAPEYNKGLKNLSLFSHAIVIFENKTKGNIIPTCLSQQIVHILHIDEDLGYLQIEGSINIQSTAILYDIKPYFPSEDRTSQTIDSPVAYQAMNNSEPLSKMGTIKIKDGNYYIKLHPSLSYLLDSLQENIYIKLFWWFHKFDKAIYRSTLLCSPPYENSPKMGVFASRSPVRPNPIALTTTKIISIDKNTNSLQVTNLDCFDDTPILGISPYLPVLDTIASYQLPSWLSHWPKWVNEDQKEVCTPISVCSCIDGIKKYTVQSKETQKLIPLSSNEKTTTTNTHHGIVIKGAKQNNLRNIDVTIPYNKITVITGVSGSGKTSLAFDTIFAESQHRFLESMTLSKRSSYKQLQKAKFTSITGVPPAIAITQNNSAHHPHSSVGTMSDLQGYLRLLFSSIGTRHCPTCGRTITTLTKQEIVSLLLTCKEGTKLTITPFTNDDIIFCNEVPKQQDKSYTTRLQQAISLALDIGEGALLVTINEKEAFVFQTTQMCHHCQRIFFDLTPSNFTYTNPDSHCSTCKGQGSILHVDVQKIITNPQISILDGASPFWGNLRKFAQSSNANWMKGEILALANTMQVDLELPWKELPAEFIKCAIYGTNTEVTFTYHNKNNGRNGSITRPVEGAYHCIERLFYSSSGNTKQQIVNTFMIEEVCPSCHGERLSKENCLISIANKRFPETIKMSILELKNWISTLPNQLSTNQIQLVENILQDIDKRTNHYIDVGLSYLTLDRKAPTLSGGELQRIKLVTQLSSGITNLLYILDEPTSGLHPKDRKKLFNTIQQLKDLGNTIIIVEHDASTMFLADYIIDIGPGAGQYGGQLIAKGTPKMIMDNKNSPTGHFLSGRKQVTRNRKELTNITSWINISGISGNNLKNISITFPTNALTCITGVSGSGKSSLIENGIYPAVLQTITKTPCPNRQFKNIEGAGQYKRISKVSQSPIGRTSRSTPATYTGIMDEIRTIYAQTKQAKDLHFGSQHFSFNSPSGQCIACKGEGRKSLDAPFMPLASIPCPLCHGKRFNEAVLAITYKQKNIAEVLEMDISIALLFFKENKKLTTKLTTLNEIGLGYIKLGQSSSTLSGGEAQRIKLATELDNNDNCHTLYLLDEPTTGLHFLDVQNLLLILDKMIHNGNTIVVVEHHMDMIKNADWIIDLGLDGGIQGGNVVVQGTPQDVKLSKHSYTGEYLRKEIQ